MNKKDKLNISYQVKSNLASYKEVDNSSRIIKAVANTFNFFDSDYDVLRLGCCKKSIQERGSASSAPDKILHALFHDLTRLPGKSMNEAEIILDGKPVLYVESKLSETIDGEETLIKYNDGIYNQHSIGFRYVQIEYIEKESTEWDKFTHDLINPEDAEDVGYGWDIKEINLHEWSTVPLGANKLTEYLGVKTANKAIRLQNIYSKMDALVSKARRNEIKNKKIFELQYQQLKQMIAESYEIKPDLKSTLTESQKEAALLAKEEEKRKQVYFKLLNS